ncbi:putative metallopeptidase [Burkholderia ubonensis]|uniref:putative metallopeptidase n=1 Tax=Burkholderia ubonensis TaxID=101571 RepID=UPI000AB059EE
MKEAQSNPLVPCLALCHQTSCSTTRTGSVKSRRRDGVAEWVTETFLREGAPLHNPDHAHLVDAEVAYLWVAVENVRQMRRVVGQCEEVMIRAGRWQRARQAQQLCEWFGRVPAS